MPWWLHITLGIVFLSAPLLYLLIFDPLWLIPVRFFHGTATAILGPVISAVIAERFPENKGAMLGQYSSATLVGRTIAPLAGGIIISTFMLYPGLVPYHMVYVAGALAAVPVLILTLIFHEKGSSPLTPLPFSKFRKSFIMFFSNARLRATALVDMATYFAFGAFETFLPLFLLSNRIDAYQIGIIFAVQVLIIAGTKPFFGKLADRFDKRLQITAGLIILGSSVALIPFTTGFSEILLVNAICGLGMSLSTVATSAYVADVARKEQIGVSMGALSSTMDIGHAAGPLITGIVIMAFRLCIRFFCQFPAYRCSRDRVCGISPEQISIKRDHRRNVVKNPVFAMVCPCNAWSIESRSAVGRMISISTAYNQNMYRCVVPTGGQGG
ncbi:MAG: MFS transporter [Methanoregula sp.]|nr:MFS transporter [Methanoregula sp.]